MTPQPLEAQIIEILRAGPGQKADEIARKLGRSRTEINQQLYGRLSNRVRQDRTYRWHLLTGAHQPGSNVAPEEVAQFADTDLAKLARYYLACLGHDDAGVSTFLTSKYGDVDYVEVEAVPRTSSAFADSPAARQLLGRKRVERGRYGLYFGYPTAVSKLRSRRSNWEGLMVEPILLFPIEQDQATGQLLLDLKFPMVNQKPLQAFSNIERDTIMNELAQLEQELGLGLEGEQPETDELAMRLQAVRPEWPWRETIAPELLSERAPLSQLAEPGIYNRAVLILAEKSPYTQGLEHELRELAKLPDAEYRNTALGQWLTRARPPAQDSSGIANALLQALPMNSEQRQAVDSALSRPLTIITGPPGTGKSQVVTNLLVNAAWFGKRILFASKNNKAVDVVEVRVNSLGSRPLLLRVGARAYQARLAEYVLALLSATTTPSDHQDFQEVSRIHERLLLEQKQLAAESGAIIELRNEVDRLEQQAEDARRRLSRNLFAAAGQIKVGEVRRLIETVEIAAKRCDRAQVPLFTRWLWPAVRRRRFAALARAMAAASPAMRALGVELREFLSLGVEPHRVRDACAATHLIISDVEAAAAYRRQLQALQAARPLEVIARDEAMLLDRIARNSSQLWKLWLKLQPSRLSPQQREGLGKYTTTLKMVIEAGDEGDLSKAVQQQYRRLQKEISSLLPCWAVTSLSARGRIPFEPGSFDLVVFDEASQCDIASALPLLYRAKSAVVIGDPMQLSHISGLQRGQDQALLEKHGLLENFPEWAYSHQSLFALAATKVSTGDIASLVDHHRSHADIIGFSNSEFYEQRLRIATRHDRLNRPSHTEPGVRWINASGRAARPSSGGAVNFNEVEAVVQALRDLVIHNRYAGTVGVVTPFRAQANAITEAVSRDDGLVAALTKAEFLADTVHKFQGDERDVMIFSPVVAEGFPAGALNFLRTNPNLFNVAVTRARAQLIVVGDRIACSQSSVGYLSRFAGYAATLAEQESQDLETRLEEAGAQYPNVARPELVSDWERLLYDSLYRAGLRPIPQYPVEKYLLDFLIVSGQRRLAIEVDGERYHRNWTGELCRRDQLRNQRLFELGYDVLRFWVYEVRDDIEGCVRRVKEGIRPEAKPSP